MKKKKLSKSEKKILDMWEPIIIDGKYTNYQVNDIGQVYNTVTKNTLTRSFNKKGYPIVGISINGKTRSKTVHRLVAKAFIPNPENKLTVNHKDGNKSNNNVSNLEWMTHKENIKHGWDNGLYNIRLGSEANASKYTESQVEQICLLLEENKLSNIEISQITDTTPEIVSKIKIKDCWVHISDEYDIPTPTSDPRGIDHPSSKYTEDQIHRVCKMLEMNNTTRTNISKATGVAKDMITHIAKGRYWKHISFQYKLPTVESSVPSHKDQLVINWIHEGLDNETIATNLLSEFGMSDRKIARECLYRVKRNYKDLLSGSTTIPKGSTATS